MNGINDIYRLLEEKEYEEVFEIFWNKGNKFNTLNPHEFLEGIVESKGKMLKKRQNYYYIKAINNRVTRIFFYTTDKEHKIEVTYLSNTLLTINLDNDTVIIKRDFTGRSKFTVI